MVWKNDTIVNEFILIGLTSHPTTRVSLFVIFFFFYLIILIGNILIIIVILTDSSLQTPMYFFLTNLSCLDICYSSTNVPRMLQDLITDKKTISFAECGVQMYVSLSFGITQCFLLAVMAYDRYIAICYPLHYTTVMNSLVCLRTALSTWLCGFAFSIVQTTITLNVQLCGHNKINHFFCEGPAFLSLGCSEILINEIITFILCVIILMIPVCFILISYINIIITILKIASSAGRRKAFSTCTSHIMAVTLYFGTCMAMYMKPKSYYSPERDKIIAVFYIVVTPMLNPLIYTLRNKDIKTGLKNVFSRKVLLL
ncbi:olfactory receptor 10A7-like [Discoglossus pictus]